MVNEIVKFSMILTLTTQKEGGRKTPIYSGFRTDLKFENEYRITVIEFDKKLLFPGESYPIICSVLLHSEQEINYLLNSQSTSIVDGSNIIGHVDIKDIISRKVV